ncbi:MAG: HAD-IIIA family hydrolase [Paludibacteraceae bacterium]
MKVVIIAGGKGTRIASIASEIPKAMIPINGKPVIEYQVELAKHYGFSEFIFVIGYLGEQIENYFGDGEKWNVSINYYKETQALNTAGALAYLTQDLKEDFFVFYGDTVMDFDMKRMLDYHNHNQSDATLFLHPNDHPYDSDIVEVDEGGRVKKIYNKPHPAGFVSRNLVNAAIFVFSPKVLKFIVMGVKSNIEKDILPKCIDNGLKLFGYISPEYVKDMGTPDRYYKVSKDVVSEKVSRLNWKNPRPAIFLDRDGVISKEVDLLHKVEQLELIEGAAEAIKYINEKGFLAIVVTNQPVIARNLCTLEELAYIHAKLETMLGEWHAYLDAIYFCPHHPDGGFPEERKEYKIKCECRKPAPGMLLRAVKEWNIDISNSIMIGDRETDMQAGNNAGVKTSIMIEQNKPYALLTVLKQLI